MSYCACFFKIVKHTYVCYFSEYIIEAIVKLKFLVLLMLMCSYIQLLVGPKDLTKEQFLEKLTDVLLLT